MLPRKDKIIALLKALASSVIWGLGQLFNRQWGKALLFFLVFALLIFVETTEISIKRDAEYDFDGFEFNSPYTYEFDFYDLIPGRDMTYETSKGHLNDYYYRARAGEYESIEILTYAAKLNDLTFDEDVFAFLDENGNEVQPESNRIQFTPEDLYTYLGERIRYLEEALNLEEYEEQAHEIAIEDVETLTDRAYLNLVNNAFFTDTDAMQRVEVKTIELAEQALLDDGHDPEAEDFQQLLDNYVEENYVSLRQDAEDIVFDAYYEEMKDPHYEQTFDTQYRRYYQNRFNRALNSFYADLLLEDDDIKAFEVSLQGGMGSRDNYGNDAYNKMLVNIYFAYQPDRNEYFVELFDNTFYNNRGFFIRGLWGVFTLGETPQRSLSDHTILGFLLPESPTTNYEARTIELAGHHSTQLLLRGIISTLLLFYFVVIWVWNIKDAYKTALVIRKERKVPSQKQYFKDLYENSFEYIVLMPALFLVTFISMMPILFGMFVAFTNYNAENLPPGQLVQWVGLDNFKAIFTLSRDGGMPFGEMFFRVFYWTIIWAVGTTVTVFFGGLFQAVILNNKRVIFRKAWRGLLILPWAVPALISQMIFRVMFQDRGYINSVLSETIIYDFFMKYGMLGRSPSEVGEGLSRFLYFGNQHIQWLTNSNNPWFTRIFLIILNIWLGFPFFMALMTGVMTSINKNLYEAASIDGASNFQQFKFITLPLVLVATSPLLIMTFAMNFNNFGMIYFVTGGGPGGSFATAYAGHTDILISWIYKLTTDQTIRWYSMASVFSILIFLIIGTVSAWNFMRTRAFKEDM